LYVIKNFIKEKEKSQISFLGFGNYVTCEWWNNLWLNEAMATWLSYKPFTEKYSHWNMVKDLIANEIVFVFKRFSFEGNGSFDYRIDSSYVGRW